MGSGSRGRPKVGDITHLRPTTEESDTIIGQAIASKAPIEVAILGVTIIEVVIEDMLRDRLSITNERHWLKLIGEGGLIGGFSKKIELTYAMGLYDSVIKHNLDVVRHIRNAFAHAKIPLDFHRSEVKEELGRINLPSKPKTTLRKALTACTRTADPQEKYLYLCLILVNALLDRQRRGLAAAIRNKDRALKRLKERERERDRFPFPDPALMGSDAPWIRNMFLGPLSGSSLQNQNADPSSPELRGLLYKPPKSEPENPRKKGK